jgi:hypothetical protein
MKSLQGKKMRVSMEHILNVSLIDLKYIVYGSHPIVFITK